MAFAAASNPLAQFKVWRVELGRRMVRLVVIFAYFFLYAPIVLLFITSFDPGEVMRFPNTGYDLTWYRFFLSDYPTIIALGNSLVLAVASSLLAAILGTLCALGFVRSDFLGKKFLNLLIFVPLIVPPVVTGIALVLLLYGLGIPKGLGYLVIGHTLLGLPYVVVVVSAQLYRFPRNLEEASLSLGANEVETFFEVTLPLLKPGILAGIVFAFMTSLQEYPATQTWAVPSFYTLPIVMYDKIRDQLSPEVNVIGVLMILIAIPLPLIAEYLRAKP
ncbi:ABC transporter permease [Bradyrhizobium sp. SRL28]|uniref:ABC transporter permease n=1 Tax=Bradyrhizobium sp. SRL28 TaxID=2836178 RepID=UPI001BDF2692|nr:ABC transporter permease [Bradyrhizobium sp. SRL28]MBT1517370.1 ABC transporter permease [Bradyrhizobium sp. SRL28]